jgi:hypothetical protein
LYRSAEDAYSSAAPDPTFTFVGGPCCPTLDVVIAFWIMIAFYTLLTSLFCSPVMSQILVIGGILKNAKIGWGHLKIFSQKLLRQKRSDLDESFLTFCEIKFV